MDLKQNNPMHGNPFRDRADLSNATIDLLRPLIPWYSPGKARLNLACSGTHYDQVAAEMEAFARPLWGIVPLLAGNFDCAQLADYQQGLANGVDPEHPEFWGTTQPFDQRLVEMASLAYALLLAPEHFWQPLSEETRTHITDWLLQINRDAIPDNNWLFFRVLVNLALKKVNRDYSEQAITQSLKRIDNYYIGNGHYRDGVRHQIDYYSPMALHFYGLVFAQLAGEDYPEFAQRFRERAHLFAQDFQYWFADDGAAIPFGRSLTYRFAQAAFWSACAFANEEVLPWGQIKGLVLRHLRWWSEQPMCDRDGVLSVGYSYPNLLMSEAYNGPGSPYWALKTFLVMALPEDHPFWQAEERPASELPCDQRISQSSGFLLKRHNGQAMALTGGQDGNEHRCHDAKYARFAYSTAFPVSVISADQYLNRPDYCAVDAGITISRDGISWLSRSRITESGIENNLAWGNWNPDKTLSIHSWACFANDGWYVLLHKIETANCIEVSEGGLSIGRTDSQIRQLSDPAEAQAIQTAFGTSAILNLYGQRTGETIVYAPNTNLLYPRSTFPRLAGELEKGCHFLVTAVFASKDVLGLLPALNLPKTFLDKCHEFGLELDSSYQEGICFKSA